MAFITFAQSSPISTGMAPTALIRDEVVDNSICSHLAYKRSVDEPVAVFVALYPKSPGYQWGLYSYSCFNVLLTVDLMSLVANMLNSGYTIRVMVVSDYVQLPSISFMEFVEQYHT